MLAVDKESDDLVYRHFYSLGHHGLSDVRIQLIDKVNDKDDPRGGYSLIWVIRVRAAGQGMVFWPRGPKQGIQFHLPLS